MYCTLCANLLFGPFDSKVLSLSTCAVPLAMSNLWCSSNAVQLALFPYTVPLTVSWCLPVHPLRNVQDSQSTDQTIQTTEFDWPVEKANQKWSKWWRRTKRTKKSGSQKWWKKTFEKSCRFFLKKQKKIFKNFKVSIIFCPTISQNCCEQFIEAEQKSTRMNRPMWRGATRESNRRTPQRPEDTWKASEQNWRKMN